MAEKDTSARTVEEYNDVFADIINGIVFDGKQVVVPEDLIDVESRSGFHSDSGELRDQDRDIVKRWRKMPVDFVLFGLENQEAPDPDMLYRGISYDGASYRMQLHEYEAKKPESAAPADDVQPVTESQAAPEANGDADCGQSCIEPADTAADATERKELDTENADDAAANKPIAIKRHRIRYPVVTFVLYLGIDRRWTPKRSIHEVFDLDPRLKPFVPNYHINVIEVAWLEPEVIDKFQSDFKALARYLRNKRINREMGREEVIDLGDEPLTITHASAFLDFIRARTEGIHNVEELLHYPTKGVSTMNFLQKAYQEKIEEGIKIGEKQGREQERVSSLRNLMAKLRMTAEQAMDTLGIPQQDYPHYLAALQQT